MKKILQLFAIGMLLISCTTENSIDTVSPENLSVSNQEQAQYERLLTSTNNIGIYKGVFTTDDSETRATVLIRIPGKIYQNNQVKSLKFLSYPRATITLTNGTSYTAVAKQFADSDSPINEMEFSSPEISFKFSVNADGTNPVIGNVTFNGKSSAMLVAKHTTLAPVMPITGTYVCTVCNGNPFINGTQEQTFNLVIDQSSGNIDSQVALGTHILNGVGLQDNCNANGNFTDCNVTSGDGVSNIGFTFQGQPITWSGNHHFNNQPSDPTVDCSGLNGTWAFDTSSYGTITGTFISDTSCMSTIFNADFQDFTGAGFSPGADPSTGKLDSNVFIATGFSDGDVAFGGTKTSGDFARGPSSGGETTGGVYAFKTDATNIAWGEQAAGSDFNPGTFVVKIQNTTGGTLNNVMVSYDIYVNNDQNRSSTFNFAYSTNGTTFTADPALNYTSPVASDTNGFVQVQRTTTIATTIVANDYIYIQFSSADVAGTGSRDEFGVDNIVVMGN